MLAKVGGFTKVEKGVMGEAGKSTREREVSIYLEKNENAKKLIPV